MLVEKSRFPMRHILFIGILPSFAKRAIYRMKGYKIGRGVNLGIGAVVVGKDVEIGEGTTIGFFAIVRAKKISIGRHVKIGSTTIIDTEKIEIGDDAKINEQVFIGGLSGPDSSIKIGKRTIIMQMSFLNPYKPLIIGDDTGIGGHCLLFTHGSWLSQLEGYPVTFAPITIGKNVWLPWRVFIMPGVSIGDNVVIGANSLVSKDLPSNCLAAGSPARVIKENYPNALSGEERTAAIRRIFDEFTGYLKYHGYAASETPTSSGLEIRFTKGKQTHIISHYKEMPHEGKHEESYDSQVGLFDFVEDIPIPTTVNGMSVDLRRKRRWSSSEIGEEFTQFVARYGIRFERMD